MSNPTTPFSWQMPTATDLVTDLPADFEVFGQAVATSMADLLGGTTGQVLSKTSATDMDFTWVTSAGDIEGVTAGTGISGGGTSGTVTVTNDMATTITTNGDLIYGTGSGTYTRRGIGSTSQVLTVAGGIPTWATPAVSASGLTLISATPCSALSSQAVTAFSATYENYQMIVVGDGTADSYMQMKLRSGATDSSTAYFAYTTRYFSSNSTQTYANANGGEIELAGGFTATTAVVDICRPFLAKRTSILSTGTNFNTTSTAAVSEFTRGVHNAQTSYDGVNVLFSSGNFTGTIFIYGYQKS